MPEPAIADDFAYISQRMRELKSEKPNQKTRYAIWFDPGDRVPGWCRIDPVTKRWGLVRKGDAKTPSLFDTTEEADAAIDNKGSGSWSVDDMEVKEYEGN